MRNVFLKTTLLTLGLTSSLSAVTTSYDVTFTGKWTTAVNSNRPSSAHFSPLIGATHNGSYDLFEVGTSASQGIENMAEVGSRSALSSEISMAMTAGAVDNLLVPGGNLGAEESFTFRIEVDSDHSLFSMVTMIAPSADWFVGVRDFDLRSGGSWLSSAAVDLISYDAGTESGNDFAIGGATHMDTTDPIELLSTAEPTGPLSSAGSIASISFTQVVPEPSSTALLGLGAMALVLRRRK